MEILKIDLYLLRILVGMTKEIRDRRMDPTEGKGHWMTVGSVEIALLNCGRQDGIDREYMPEVADWGHQ